MTKLPARPTVVFLLSGPVNYGAPMMAEVAPFAAVTLHQVGKTGFVLTELSVDHLRAELAARGVAPPYIFAAHSFAGFTAIAYTHRYPGEVAGLALLDSTHPRQTPTALRSLPAAGEPTTPAIEEFRRFIQGWGPVYGESCAFVGRITSLGAVPLMVLVAGKPDMPAGIGEPLRSELTRGFHQVQREHARLSSDSEFQIIPGVGHDLFGQAPREVKSAILRLVEKSGRAP